MATERKAGGDGLNPAVTPSPLDMRTLVVDHHRDVYRYAYRLTGRVVDAEDLTQQTFLIAQQRLHQVRQPERVLSWLFAILRTCYLKSERKSVPLPATGIELDVDSIPDGAAETAIDEELLQAAIGELPDEFKLVLVMFYFEECSYREIAERLQIPIGTVMSRLTRAKGRLRARLLEADKVSEPKTTRQTAAECPSKPILGSGRAI